MFIIMVLSIRKISYENDDLGGAGIWWFKNLNEADPYMILPFVATLLNYINLGVTLSLLNSFIAGYHKRE
jgi:membrane protein insertase Oxa1/YidC/SpoIIIJ